MRGFARRGAICSRVLTTSKGHAALINLKSQTIFKMLGEGKDKRGGKQRMSTYSLWLK
jgi:hypothetical protein